MIKLPFKFSNTEKGIFQITFRLLDDRLIGAKDYKLINVKMFNFELNHETVLPLRNFLV